MTSISKNPSSQGGQPGIASSRKIWRVGALTYTTGGLAMLFLWLLGGDFALAMRDRAIPPVMQSLFKNFGASDMMTGLVFASVPAARSLFVGPIVAYKSDRLRSPLGPPYTIHDCPRAFYRARLDGPGVHPPRLDSCSVISYGVFSK